jgi:hypothetical protein
VDLLGGEQGKAAGEIKTHLPAEEARGADAGSLVSPFAAFQHLGEKVEIGSL